MKLPFRKKEVVDDYATPPPEDNRFIKEIKQSAKIFGFILVVVGLLWLLNWYIELFVYSGDTTFLTIQIISFIWFAWFVGKKF